MKQALSPAEEEEEEAWSYAWDYTMGSPDTALWDYPIGTGSVSMSGDDGLYFIGYSGNGYGGLRLKDDAAWFGQKATYEVEVKIISTDNNGFRILCVSGSNGVSDNHGLQVTLNENYLNVLTGSTGVSAITKTATVTYGEWHKVRLELDTHTGTNKVYLDDRLVAMIANADLSKQYISRVWSFAQGGHCYVRAVRYRKED